MTDFDYLATNRALWNAKVDIHYASEFYAMPQFLQGQTSLRHIELGLLGDLAGKSVLHLQCHFGQDTLSLLRAGAQRAVGVDLSDRAIKQAEKLAELLNLPAEFICCDLYSLHEHTEELFDLVFTSYGTTTWLPDLDQWAQTIARRLKKGGRLLFVDFHPVVWMFDDDFTRVGYDYFNTGAIVEDTTGTYAQPDAPIKGKYVGWNHSVSETLNALLKVGLRIEYMQEYDYSPYTCFKHLRKDGEEQYRIEHLQHRIPMTWALSAWKD